MMIYKVTYKKFHRERGGKGVYCNHIKPDKPVRDNQEYATVIRNNNVN